jgi:hypothetical protein
MSDRRSPCSLGLSREILSAWRDRLLPEIEAQRITRHVATCSTCQARLAQFDRIAAALRRQPAPDLRAQTWRGLQARLARKERRPLRLPRTAAFRGLGATAFVAAIIVLFVVILGHQRPSTSNSTGPASNTPTPTATATSVPDCPNFPAGYYTQIPNPGYTSTDVFANIPLPPSSRIVPNDASGGLRGYDVCSAGTVDSITSYMTAHLTELGWTSQGGGIWTKNGYSLTVRIPSAAQWNVSWRDPDQHF